MRLDIQFNLKSNPNYIKYLRENSYWYKILTREPSMFKEFVSEVKKNYKLRPIDKIEDAISTIEMLSMLMNSMK